MQINLHVHHKICPIRRAAHTCIIVAVNHRIPMITLKMGLKPETVNIDEENRMLNGVVAIEPMDIKDWRPFSINQEFVNDLVAAGKKEKKGVKSHFGHNYNNEGLLLGRASNWRVEDGKAKFDLKIEEFADDSPKMPGMGNYVFKVLKADEDALMNSIVFREQYFYQEAADGQKVKCYYYDKKSGSWISPNPELGKVYPKLGQLHNTDIVSEGAATNSMFSMTEDTPQEQKSLTKKIKDFFLQLFEDEQSAGEFDPETPILSPNTTLQMDVQATPAAPVAAPAPDAAALQIQQLQAELESLKTANTALKTENDKFSALEQRLAAIEATPAAPPTVLNAGSGSGHAQDETVDLWEQDPINIQALSRFPHLKSTK